MANAIALGTGAANTTFTLTDGQRKTVSITASQTADAPPPAGGWYILAKKMGATAFFTPVMDFDASKTPFAVEGNGDWRIARDTTRHPSATALDLD